MFSYKHHILSDDTFTIKGIVDGKTVTKKIHASGLADYMGLDVMQVNSLFVDKPKRVMGLDYFEKYAETIKGGQLIAG